MDRRTVIRQAIMQCLKELYLYVQPKVTWEEFEEENKEYSKKYKYWERYTHLKCIENKTEKQLREFESFPSNWKDKNRIECIGPAPYGFYYLNKEILKDICDSYINAYKLDEQQNLLDIIETLKNYCKDPIVDKYIEGKGKPGDEDYEPGHRDYIRPNNLETELFDLLPDSGFEKSEIVKATQDKFFKFLDMAGNFFSWNRELNGFNTEVYLGPSPDSNKERVIENWKQYRNKDIEIDEEQMKIDYYGEEY